MFKGHPEILTPGYYYFNDNAPFYPGLHNLGSGVWTSDDFTDPPLGEAKVKRTYRKGGLPVPPPPAVLVGSADCVANGAAYPVPLLVRTLPAGVDSRCFSSQGLAVPDPSPALWFRPSTIATATIGQVLYSWPDSSIYGRDATLFTLGNQPTVQQPDGVHTGVQFNRSQFLAIANNPTWGGDFAVYAVVWIPAVLGVTNTVLILPNAGTLNIAPIQVSRTSMGVSLSSGTFGVSTPDNRGGLHLFSARNAGGRLVLNRDSLKLSDAPGYVPPTFAPNSPASLGSPQPATQGPILIEVQAYDQTLSDAGEASILASLRTIYGF